MNLQEAISRLGYKVDRHGRILAGPPSNKLTSQQSVLLGRIKGEKLYMKPDPHNPSQVEEVLNITSFCDKNGVKYSENPPRGEVAQQLRTSADGLTSLVDRLSI